MHRIALGDTEPAYQRYRKRRLLVVIAILCAVVAGAGLAMRCAMRSPTRQEQESRP
jgi:hypothetical protein